MARVWGRRLFLAASWAFVALLLAQLYLAGMGVFAGDFATHRNVGYTAGLLPILMFVFALIGRMGRLDVALTIVLFVQGILQSVFVLQRASAPTVAAIHSVNGVLMLLIGIYLAIDAWRQLRAPATGPPQPPTTATPNPEA